MLLDVFSLLHPPQLVAAAFSGQALSPPGREHISPEPCSAFVLYFNHSSFKFLLQPGLPQNTDSLHWNSASNIMVYGYHFLSPCSLTVSVNPNPNLVVAPEYLCAGFFPEAKPFEGETGRNPKSWPSVSSSVETGRNQSSGVSVYSVEVTESESSQLPLG